MEYRISLFIVLLFISIVLPAQKVDTTLHFSEKLPTGNKIAKKWKEQKVYFSEFAEGTGEGIFKKPEENWSTHPDFRAVTVRIVGKDSLLLKFRTAINWRTDAVKLGRCNATTHQGIIKAIHYRPGPFYDTAPGALPQSGWHWEIIIAWPWDNAFRDRLKPFGFFITFVRDED
jgi:hypothetical protein